jgi:hypothetical protein
MKNTLVALGFLVSMFFMGTKNCDAKLYIQVRNHSKYDAVTSKCIPSKHGWGEILRLVSSNSLNKNDSSKNIINREVSLNINEGSDLVFLSVTPKGQNELAGNKLVKVNKMIISKGIAKYNLGVNSEIEIPEQIAKVEEDSQNRIKISIKFSHPEKG